MDFDKMADEIAKKAGPPAPEEEESGIPEGVKAAAEDLLAAIAAKDAEGVANALLSFQSLSDVDVPEEE